MKKQLEFCKKHNLTENQFCGKKKIGDYLDLRSLTSIPEGFNPTVGSSLYLSSLTSIPEGFNPTVGDYLDLRSLTSIPEGFNPTVGSSLYLSSLTSIPEGFNPTVGSSLYLSSLTSIPEGFNPTVGGSLYLSSLTSIPEGFNPTVGGSFDLSSLTSIPEGFNPAVGGSLYLRSLTSIPEGFNPTVGGSFDLSSLTSIPEGFNPAVGGSLYLSSHLSAKTKKPKTSIIFFKNNKYVSVDGIFTEVLNRRGNVFKVKRINDTKEFYLVSDLKFTHAHGDTLKKANEDFNFKIVSDKLKKEPIKKDTLIDIKYYRLITGACKLGVEYWINANGIKQDKIKAVDLLPILEKSNAYGLSIFKQLITF